MTSSLHTTDSCYLAISRHYGDQRAKRSNVLLMDHIHEGLIVLDRIDACQDTKRAYCLHPLVQSDDALLTSFNPSSILRAITTPIPLVLTMEYRRSANSFLSRDKLSDLRMSPLREVRDMLIADKVQNRKDFDTFHKATHPRSAELALYFSDWLAYLGITEARYTELIIGL